MWIGLAGSTAESGGVDRSGDTGLNRTVTGTLDRSVDQEVQQCRGISDVQVRQELEVPTHFTGLLLVRHHVEGQDLTNGGRRTGEGDLAVRTDHSGVQNMVLVEILAVDQLGGQLELLEADELVQAVGGEGDVLGHGSNFLSTGSLC